MDDDINIFDPDDIEFAIATRVKGDEDIYIYPNVRGSTLDPRSENGIGTKMGIDATMDLSKRWKLVRVQKPKITADKLRFVDEAYKKVIVWQKFSCNTCMVVLPTCERFIHMMANSGKRTSMCLISAR